MNTKTIFSVSSICITGATLMASLFSAPSARADEVTPAQAPSVINAAPSQPDHALDAPAKSSFKSVALELNPLATAIGRYSIQAEWLPAMHHAIVLNPHIDHASYDVGVSVVGAGSSSSYNESLTGFGTELGYRFYTGEKGANGFYVGPSVLVAHYSASATGFPSQSFNSVGGAVDAGGQWIIGPGVVVGFGFGLQYTSVSGNADTNGLPLAAAVMAGGGVRPRALLSIGYAF